MSIIVFKVKFQIIISLNNQKNQNIMKLIKINKCNKKADFVCFFTKSLFRFGSFFWNKNNQEAINIK